jgi:hypothetical protein
MPTGSFTAQGSIVNINGTEIKEVTEFTLPSISRPEVDATHLRSTSREYLAGLRDNTEFSFTVNYLPGDPGQRLLRASAASPSTQTMQVVLPDDPDTSDPYETWEFQALITGFEPTGSVDEVMRAEATMRVSGDVTHAPPL